MEVGGFSAFVVGLALLPFIGSWVESTLWTCATCAACAIRASLRLNKLNIYIYISYHIPIPVVPHKAVAEVSKIGNL